MYEVAAAKLNIVTVILCSWIRALVFSCGVISLQQNKNIHKFGLKPTNPASLHLGSVESHTHTLTASRVVWVCVCVYSMYSIRHVRKRTLGWVNEQCAENHRPHKKNTTSINLCMRRRPLHRRGQRREARASRQTWPWDLMTRAVFAQGQRRLMEQHLHSWIPPLCSLLRFDASQTQRQSEHVGRQRLSESTHRKKAVSQPNLPQRWPHFERALSL